VPIGIIDFFELVDIHCQQASFFYGGLLPLKRAQSIVEQRPIGQAVSGHNKRSV
jgi:hypothetical protein